METDRRFKILETAKELFLHHGFKKVTLADIAKQVGVSRPTLYQAFTNKEEIYKALIIDWQEDALVRIEEALEPGTPAAKQLKTAIGIWVVEPFKLIRASPRAADFQDATFSFAEETIDAGYAKFRSVIRGILESANLSGPVSTPKLSRLMVVSLRGFKGLAADVKELKSLIKSLVALALAD